MPVLTSGDLCHVVFGSRGSALALAQTSLVIDRFRHLYPALAAEVSVVRTEGDVDKVSPLTEIGGRGVFTNALQDAILLGKVDAAVHSAKDLPSAIDPRAPLVAIPERDDPRDVLVSRHGVPLGQLPPRPVIGTSSRRREIVVRQLRPDARIVNLRGNVDTRLQKAAAPELDGIVLAAAGLHRLGREDRITEYLPVEMMVPAPAQGALAVQAKASGEPAALLAVLDDPRVSAPVRVERAFLAALGAGCTVPVGAYARFAGDRLHLLAMLGESEGDRISQVDEPLARGDEADHAAEIARRMLAGTLPQPVTRWNGWRPGGQLAGARVVVTRPRRQAAPLLAALQQQGAEAIPFPTTRIEPTADRGALTAVLLAAAAGEFTWLVATSTNAVDALTTQLANVGIPPGQLAHLNVAAVGRVTAAAVREIGLTVAVVPDQANAAGLAAVLRGRIGESDRVLYPRSAIAQGELSEALRALGADVTEIVAYHTVSEPDIDGDVLARLVGRDFDVVTFSSPSSVRGYLELLGAASGDAAGVAAVCVGRVTAAAAAAAGFAVAAAASDPGVVGMVDAVISYWRTRNGGVVGTRVEAEGERAVRSAD